LKKYEALFIFPNALKDEDLQKVVDQQAEEITRLGGSVENRIDMGKRSFARRMNKKDSGYYVRMDFSLDPAQISALRSRYALKEDVFRVQVVLAEPPIPEAAAAGEPVAQESASHGQPE
jgi:small subunit ribosomal protein S6